MKYFFIIIFIILLLFNRKEEEPFNGMSYIERHKYLRCCSYFGCGHSRCQRFLEKHKSPMILMGVAYAKASRRKPYNIYGRMNMDSRQYEYFIRIYNRDGDFFVERLHVKYLNNGDNIVINKINYTVTLYEKTDGHRIFNKFHTSNSSRGHRSRLNVISRDFKKYGYVRGQQRKDYMFIYKKQTGRNRWNYYVKMGKSLIPLIKYKNRYINENDKINLPINKKKYTFRKFDN
jgi:hypothetical protein